MKLGCTQVPPRTACVYTYTGNQCNVLQDDCWDRTVIKEELKDEVSVEEHEECVDRLVYVKLHINWVAGGCGHALKAMFVFCHSAEQLTASQGSVLGQPKSDGESDVSREDSGLVSTFLHVQLDGKVENNVQTVNLVDPLSTVSSKQFPENPYFTDCISSHTEEKPYSCDICNKTYLSKGSYKHHYRSHTAKKTFVCDVCNKKFSIRKILKNHYRIHTGEKPFECSVCNAKFSRSASLHRHRTTHTEVKQYKCNICGKDFSRNDHLKKHYRTHTGVKIYKCEVCNKQFSQKENLVIHGFIHTGKKPYTCEVCNRSFSQGGHLNAHKLIHTGEKPYNCDVCNKKFPVREKLRRHYRIHTGEKPYECGVCERSFTELGNLKRHHSRVHDKEMPDSVQGVDNE